MNIKEAVVRIKGSPCKESIVLISRGCGRNAGQVSVYPFFKKFELNLDERINELVGIYTKYDVQYECLEEDYQATLRHLQQL